MRATTRAGLLEQARLTIVISGVAALVGAVSPAATVHAQSDVVMSY